MFGLTRKLLGEDYLIVKKSIYKELKGLFIPLEDRIGIIKKVVIIQLVKK